MENISTELGKIYCKYNEETDDFDKLRVVRIDENENGDKIYLLRYMDENYRLFDNEDEPLGESYLEETFNNTIKKEWVLLKSEGIVSITNIVSIENEFRSIKDIIAIYFPNNKMTRIPDIRQPYVVARQGINNLFAELAGLTDEVGVSVSLETLPTGYALIDFMENSSVISSKLCHVYKTDTEHNLSIILDNNDTSEILEDLFEHRVRYLENTNINFDREALDPKDCIDGYCLNLRKFLENSGFTDDLYRAMGIMPIDFAIESTVPIKDDDKLLLSTIYGGIRINKAIPIKFDYDVNLDAIKMKYLIVIDLNKLVWIIPYTEFTEEIYVDDMYNLTEERTIQIQERLAKCVKAYDKSKNIESGSISDMIVDTIN